MKNILIVEDNKASREELRSIISEIDKDICVYETDNSEEAYVLSMKYNITVFLVDIALVSTRKSMDNSGADFAVNIRNFEKYRFTPIIIISVFADDNLIMYSSAQIYKYIEKPFDRKCAKMTIIDALHYEDNNKKPRKLIYPIGGLLESIEIDKIIYAKSVEHSICIVTKEYSVTVPYLTCKEFMDDVNDDRFVKCYRGTVVNIEYIKSIDTVNRYIALKDCADILGIGLRYIKEVIKKYYNL